MKLFKEKKKEINGKNCYLMKIVTKLKKKLKAEEWEKKSNTNRSQYPVSFENNTAPFAAPA